MTPDDGNTLVYMRGEDEANSSIFTCWPIEELEHLLSLLRGWGLQDEDGNVSYDVSGQFVAPRDGVPPHFEIVIHPEER